MSPVVEEIRLSLPHIELAAHIFWPRRRPARDCPAWLAGQRQQLCQVGTQAQGLRIVALDHQPVSSDHRPRGAGYALADYAFDVLRVASNWAGNSLRCWGIRWGRLSRW